MAISVPRYDHICDMSHDLAFIGQFYIDWRNGYLYRLGGNGDIDSLARLSLIASYLLYWSLVVYPLTSDELKGYARNVHYLMVGMVFVLVLGVLYCTTCHRRGGSWSVGSSEYSLLCARVRNSFPRASVC